MNTNNTTEFEYARFSKRLLSSIIDYAFITLLIILFKNVIAVSFFEFISQHPESSLAVSFRKLYQSNFADFVMYSVIFAAMPLIVNFGIFVWAFGGSIGQKIMKLWVVSEEYRRCSLLRAFIRIIIMLPIIITTPIAARIITNGIMKGEALDHAVTKTFALSAGPYAIMLVCWIISILTVIYSAKKQSLHDMVAGTIVIEAK